MEQWRDITECNGYEISSAGNVRNKYTGNTLKPMLNNKGYARVKLGGRYYLIHRLVAQAFIPNNQSKPQVNHKDGDKLNNHVKNLEWVTDQENREHALINGLVADKTKPKAVLMDGMYKYESVRDAERRTGIDKACISRVINGKAKQAKGHSFVAC